MIYDSILDRIRQFIQARPFRVPGLLLMLTACLFFAGRQGIVSRAAEQNAAASVTGRDSTEALLNNAEENVVEGGQSQSAAQEEGTDASIPVTDGESISEEPAAEEEIEEGSSTDEDEEEIEEVEEGSDEEAEEEEAEEETEETEDKSSETTAASQAGTPVRIILSGEKRFKAGNYYFHANKDFNTLYYSRSETDEGDALLIGDSFSSTFVSDGKDLYYFTADGLTRLSIDDLSTELVMPMEKSDYVTPYILQVYKGKYYYTLYQSDTNSVFYCYDSKDGQVSTIAEDRLAPDLYPGAEGQYMILMSTDFSKTYLYDCSSGQTHEIGQGTVTASFWQGMLYVSQINNYKGNSAHLKACSLPDLKVVKAITIGENILTNSFADGCFYYSYGKQDDTGNLTEEHFVQVDPLTGEQKSISKEECNLALYNQADPGAN